MTDDDQGPSADESREDEDGAVDEIDEELERGLRNQLPQRPIQPEELASVVAKILSVEIRQHRRPLPDPETLSRYEEKVPGLAIRIVDRADKEQGIRHEVARHGMEMDRRALIHNARKTYLGQILAFLVALLAIGGGLWLLASGKSTEGLASIISALVALVVAFVTGKITELVAARKSQKSQNGSG